LIIGLVETPRRWCRSWVIYSTHGGSVTDYAGDEPDRRALCSCK